jgi:magnesium-transporting ATPase (P-type)
MLISNQSQSQVSSVDRNLLIYFLLFAVFIPYDLTFLYDFMVMILKFRLSRKKSLKAQNEFFKIIDPNPMGNLGLVDYVFLDKTGTLTKGNLDVEMILHNNKIFKIDAGTLRKKMKKENQFKGLSRSDSKSEYFHYLSEIEDIQSQLSLDSTDNCRLQKNMMNFDGLHKENPQKMISGLVTYSGNYEL